MNSHNNTNSEMNEFQITIHLYNRRLMEKRLCDLAQGWVSSWMLISLWYNLKNFYNHSRLLKLEQSLKPVFGDRKSHQKNQKQNCSGGGQTATVILNYETAMIHCGYLVKEFKILQNVSAQISSSTVIDVWLGLTWG